MKSTKSALKRAIGETILMPMELYTCLLEVANLLNQRPIGKLSEDPNDGTYLCPNDIVLGTSTVPQGPFRETLNPRQGFEFCQKIVDSYLEEMVKRRSPAYGSQKEVEYRKPKCQG